MTLRCISWIAVSSQPQTEKESPREQRAANRALIKQLKGHLVAELEVPGHTRDIISFERACDEMDAYAQLRDLIAVRGADLLVCRDLSRLGRTQALIAQVVAYCQAAGIALYPRNAPPATIDAAEQAASDSSVLLTAINASFAEIELNMLRRRYQYGMRGRVESGQFYARIPYGWRKVYDERGKKRYEVDPVAAAVIRHALIDLYLHRGLSLDVIADILNDEGHVGPDGGPWTRGRLQNVMRRLERFAGWTTANLASGYVRARGKFDPIMTDEEVDAILAEQESRSHGGRSTWRRYLFSLCVVCGQCGRKYAGTTHWKYEHLRYYRCPRGCGGHIAERDLIAELERAIAFAQDADNVADILSQTPAAAKRIEVELAAVAAEVEAIAKQRQRYTRAYSLEEIEETEYRQLMQETVERRTALQRRQDELTRQLHAARDADLRAGRIAELAAQGGAVVEAARNRALTQEEMKKHNAWIRRLLRFTAAEGRILQVEFL